MTGRRSAIASVFIVAVVIAGTGSLGLPTRTVAQSCPADPDELFQTLSTRLPMAVAVDATRWSGDLWSDAFASGNELDQMQAGRIDAFASILGVRLEDIAYVSGVFSDAFDGSFGEVKALRVCGAAGDALLHGVATVFSPGAVGPIVPYADTGLSSVSWLDAFGQQSVAVLQVDTVWVGRLFDPLLSQVLRGPVP